MRGRFWPLPGLAALGLLSACAAGPGQPSSDGRCHVTKVAEHKLVKFRRLLLVPVSIDHHEALMLLDTGAQISTLSGEAVQKFDILTDTLLQTTVIGVGGYGKERSAAVLSDFTFAGYSDPRSRLPVVDMPIRLGDGQVFGGILGADILQHFDLDLDVPRGRLTVYDVRGCQGDFVPWSGPHVALKLSREASATRLSLPVKVNGVSFDAMLDTGAESTLIDQAAAERAGVRAEGVAKERAARGFGAAGVDVGLVGHQFESLEIGPIKVKHPTLAVLDRSLRHVDMLLGEDFVSAVRLWISYQTEQLFIGGLGK